MQYSYRWENTPHGPRLRRHLIEQPKPVALDTLKKAELVAMAEQRGVDAEGTKADIVARLEADDD